VVTDRSADDKTQQMAPKPQYSHKTLVRIKHARVARDLTLCVGGVVFTVLSFVIPVPSYTVNDPFWIFALVIAVVFGIAALIRGLAEPAWDRRWSSLALRRICSVVAMVVGAYFIVFALDQSGYVGLQGSGVAANCQYESDSGIGVRSGGSHSYGCDVDVRWSDGSTTHERLNATMPVHSGQTVEYAKSSKTGPWSIFPVGDQPIAAWTNAWFYLSTGLAIFLSALFALCVALVAKRPKTS
jgi:hypothetical protein